MSSYRNTNRNIQKSFRQHLRNDATPAERELWKYLKGKKTFGLKFRRQHGFGPFVVDFYCASLNLVIELDGNGHIKGEQALTDEARDDYLERRGLKVLRFENRMVWESPSSILKAIEKELEKKML